MADDRRPVDDGAPHGAELDVGAARHLARAVREVYRESVRVNDRLAAQHGIPSADFTALLFLAGSESPTPKHLSEELGLTTSAITALLDRLESADLVVRAPNPRDRRSLIVRLRPRGEQVKSAVYREYLGALAEGIAVEPRLGSPDAALYLHLTAAAIARAIPD